MAGVTNSWNNYTVGATDITITSSGSGDINLNAGLGDINMTSTDAVNITSMGAITANSATGTISVSTDATNTTVNIATGAGVKTTTIGSFTGASSTTVRSGTGNLVLGTNSVDHDTYMGSSTGVSLTQIDCGTGGCSLGASLNSHSTTIGSGFGTSNTNVYSGSGPISIASTNGLINIESGTGDVRISSDATANIVDIATGPGAKTLTLGSTNTTSTTQLNSGSGGVKLKSETAGAVVTASTSAMTSVNGTAGHVLTSNGAGSAPSFQAAPGGSITITGDTGGGLVGTSFTFTGGTTGLSFGGAVSTETLSGTLVVSNGGTGVATMTTAYAPVCAGTTATGALQVASTGLATAGYVLTSNGNAALPSFQAAPSPSVLTYTAVSTTPYVVLSTDVFIGVNSSGGARQVNLPNAPTTGRFITIKDTAGTANTNNITITTVGGAVTIDGATTYVMNTQYAAVNVLFDGATYQIW